MLEGTASLVTKRAGSVQVGSRNEGSTTFPVLRSSELSDAESEAGLGRYESTWGSPPWPPLSGLALHDVFPSGVSPTEVGIVAATFLTGELAGLRQTPD